MFVEVLVEIGVFGELEGRVGIVLEIDYFW